MINDYNVNSLKEWSLKLALTIAEGEVEAANEDLSAAE